MLRSKCWQFVAYPPNDDGSDNNHFPVNVIIDNLTRAGAKFAYIVHDQDEGTKPHYHFVVQFATLRADTAIQRITGLKSLNAILAFAQCEVGEKVKYLTHRNAPDKYRYEDTSVHLVGWTDMEYEQLVTAPTPVNESKEDVAIRLFDVARAYVNRALTLEQCVMIAPCIVHNMRNFLSICDTIRTERVRDDVVNAITAEAERNGTTYELQALMHSWHEYHKGGAL